MAVRGRDAGRMCRKPAGAVRKVYFSQNMPILWINNLQLHCEFLTMTEAFITLERPSNEPVYGYAPGSRERDALKRELARMAGVRMEIPLIIGGKEVRTGRMAACIMPHDHGHVLAEYHMAGEAEVRLAVAAAAEAWKDWSRLPWTERLAVFLKAAELLSTAWRMQINAATMLNQSKTVYQAEIDAVCELVDFLRFNAYFAGRIYRDQPASAKGLWNQVEWRPLEGFVFAVSPFNFTSIAGNLAAAPALMGNTVLWKPASTSVFSNYQVMRLFMAAGLPPGVINFIPGSGREVGRAVLSDRSLAGVHFTGSAQTFRTIWQAAAASIDRFRSYPRLVGETGGKDFIVAHPSADVGALATAMVRGAFEYQGQKCSAASRAYIPASLWPGIEKRLRETLPDIAVGDPRDFTNFMGAVIDAAAYEKICGYIDFAAEAGGMRIVSGGGADRSRGFFIKPTLVETRDPHAKLMTDEVFGPLLTVFVYQDSDFEQVLQLCDRTSPYGLTGAVFATDRTAIRLAREVLRHAAGNFYVNDKPTGAVVGMQPFGGSRASGTNDKAGSRLNLLRWVSPRTIKETFVPPTDYRYIHMLEP